MNKSRMILFELCSRMRIAQNRTNHDILMDKIKDQLKNQDLGDQQNQLRVQKMPMEMDASHQILESALEEARLLQAPPSTTYNLHELKIINIAS